MVGQYNPEIPFMRKHLAALMINMLNRSGFSEIDRAGTYEKVYIRNVTNDGKIQVQVWTSIDKRENEIRLRGADSIRVTLIYKNGETERGLSKQTRTFRTGKPEDIVDRVLQRMRQAWESASTVERCSCGAPKFRSRKGNMVCTDLCWKK